MDPAARAAIADMLKGELKPYDDVFPRYDRLPATGRARDEVLAEMHRMRAMERSRWEDGFASGAVYHGDPAHLAFLDEVYALNSQANPLHADLWPSATKYEAEIVAMVAAMLNGGPGSSEAGPSEAGPSDAGPSDAGPSDAGPSDAGPSNAGSSEAGTGTSSGGSVSAPLSAPDACGTVTSGGTESILLAMKTYRDWARAERGVERPNVVLPVTAHAAFDKAGHYFGLELRRVPVGEDMRADVAAARELVDDQTIAMVGSAVQFPHGVMDPIEDLAAIAAERGIGMHTDSCLGGFVLPWAERLGHPVPPFDFRVPGVTSMSCDTHKYGYAAKGTSVVLYRDPDLRAYQYYRTTDWPGGLYFSPTLAGSRPGALSAQAWAAMVSIGESGYLEATRRILETAAVIRKGIAELPALRVLGDPLWVIAFASDEVNIYDVLDRMGKRGWSLNGLQRPAAVHIAVTLRHTVPGVAERFLADLAACVAEAAAAGPDETAGFSTPIYGMAASVEGQGMVQEILRTYIDVLYTV